MLITKSHKKLNNQGFTLTETVLALVVVSIMAVTAFPILMSFQAVNLDGACRKIEADVRYAQSLAMTTGEEHGFRTTGGNGGTSYEVYNVGTGAIVDSPYDHLPLQEDFSSQSEEYKGITFVGSDTIEFDDEGNASFPTGDGIITLTNTESDTKSVTASATGLVSIN